MLYNNFIVCIMTCAGLAMINMIYDQHWRYILLPIGIIIWGCYKFFKDNDRNYRKSMGLDPDEEDSWSDFFLGRDYTEYNGYRGYNYNNAPRRNGNTITWDNNDTSRRVEDDFDSNLFGGGGTTDYTRYQPSTYRRNWQDPRYKGMLEKCKRNFKITVEENKTKDEEKPRTKLFFGSHHSGA